MKYIVLFLALLFAAPQADAQSSKGFDYQKHQRMNKKAKRWGERRYKAAGKDQTNLRCTTRQSRKAARQSRRQF